MKLSDIRYEAFKLDKNSLEYYFRGEAKNGRIHCKCYTKGHQRYKYLDRYLKRSTKAIIVNL